MLLLMEPLLQVLRPILQLLAQMGSVLHLPVQLLLQMELPLDHLPLLR